MPLPESLFERLPHIEDYGTFRCVFHHYQGTTAKILLTQVRKITAGLRTILIDGAVIVRAQEWAGLRLEMFCSITRDLDIAAVEIAGCDVKAL